MRYRPSDGKARTFTVVRLRQWLPAGGDRQRTLVQFYAQTGGMRTVAADDLRAL